MNGFLTFFLLPGRLITWAQYMFPAKGQVWASARRKDSVMVQALFSFLVWGAILWLGAAALADGPRELPIDAAPGDAHAALVGDAATAELADRVEHDADDRTAEAADDLPRVATAQPAAPSPVIAQAASPDGSSDALQSLTLASAPELDRAAREALASGKPRRWKSAGLAVEGYAVVSEEQPNASGGCRTLYFTAGRVGAKEVRSADLTFCRTDGSSGWTEN